MNPRDLAELLATFERDHGHLITTALNALAAEQAKSAEVVGAEFPAAGKAFSESADAYRRASAAWDKLAEALDDWTEAQA